MVRECALRSVLAVLLLTVMAPHGRCPAQRAEVPSCPAELYIWVDTDGALSMELDLSLSPPWMATARYSFESALGAKLDHFSNSKDQCDPGWTCFYMEFGPTLSRDALSLRGAVPLAGLRTLLQSSGYQEVDIYLEMPDSPAVNVSMKDAELIRDSRTASFSALTEVADLPETLEFFTGYPMPVVVGRLGMLLAGTALFLMYLLWHYRKAARLLGRSEEDSNFHLFAAVQKSVLLGPIFGIVTFFVSGLEDIITFAGAGTAVASVLDVVLILAPMTVIYAWGMLLLQRLQFRIRGRSLTDAQSVSASLLHLGRPLLPMGLVGLGAFLLLSSRIITGCACLVLAVAAFFYCSSRLMKVLGVTCSALTEGDLRRKVCEMAENAGVKVGQVFLLTMGEQLVMANAGATNRDSVIITDQLVRQLSRREVDAIVAHEIAHLKLKHPRNRGWAAILMFLIVGLCVGVVPVLGDMSGYWWFLLTPFAVAGCLFFTWVCRRQEEAADRLALQICGDPESLRSGLAALHRLQMFPSNWGKWPGLFISHPPLERRLEVINGEASKREYAVPETDDCGSVPYTFDEGAVDRLFSTQFKFRNSILLYLTMRTVMALVPLGIALFALNHTDGGAHTWLVYGAGIPLSFLAALFLQSVLATFGFRGLGRTLRSRLIARHPEFARTEARFVSLAPGPHLTVHEVYTNTDIGFLGFDAEYLWYLGDGRTFALHKTMISEVTLVPGAPEWWRSQHVRVTWHELDGVGGGSFRIWPGDRWSTLQTTSGSRQLLHWLQKELAAPPDNRPAPSWVAQTATPPSETVGVHPSDSLTPGRVFRQALVQFEFAFFAGIAAGFLSSYATAWAYVYTVTASTALYLLMLLPLIRVRRGK